MVRQTRIIPGSIPKYRQLLIILRKQILTGQWVPGERLPSEEEIGDTYGLSRGTVRRAIAQLEAERLIETTHGVGSFVRQTYPHTIPFRFVDPACSPPGPAGPVSYQIVVQETITAPMDIAERLRVPFGTSVIHIARRMCIEGRPVSYSERYLPEQVLPALIHADLSKVHSLHELLIAASDYPLLRAELEIEAHLLTEEEAHLLQANPGESAIIVNRLTYSAPNIPAVWYTALFKEGYYLGIKIGNSSA